MKNTTRIATLSVGLTIAIFAIAVTLIGLRSKHQALPSAASTTASQASQSVNETGATSRSDQAAKMKINEAFGKMPLYFIENRGQLDSRVAFYVQGQDKSLYFTSEGITFALISKQPKQEQKAKLVPASFREEGHERDSKPEKTERYVIKLDFIGANPNITPKGQEQTSATISYFKGKPEEWKAGLKTYSSIVYENLWPGIDLVYRGTAKELKYEFVVKPGADPNQIKLAYRGASSLKVNHDGQLEVNTPAGGFHDVKPYSYQEANGQRAEIVTQYHLTEDRGARHSTYSFSVGSYDSTRPLIIDPAMLVYCGYVGGTNDDYPGGIAVDSSGNAYVTGATFSNAITQGFPATVGPDTSYNGNEDAFVAKVNANGTGLVYCGYIGGTDTDYGRGVALDSSGNAYVTGGTWSDATTEGFPATVGPDTSHNGRIDAFVVKVNANGTGLVYCGYVGGTEDDYGHGIALDSSGNAYVTGQTSSDVITQGFPAMVGPDTSYNGGHDAFVAKVNANGTGLVYCGYIGGTGPDLGHSIAVDSSGNAYVTGQTFSDATTEGFPATVGPDTSYNGGADAFVAKVNTNGMGLAYCGYIGGTEDDYGLGIAVDSSGNAYITGYTLSDAITKGFPATVGPDTSYNGGQDAFVAKVNTNGMGLAYCGYIGGTNHDYGLGIAVDSSGNAYVTGQTFSDATTEGFPATVGPDTSYNGGADAFVAKVNANGMGLVYCGYIGGTGLDYGHGIAVDSGGNAYITGQTHSDAITQGFPATVGPDTSYNDGADAFIAKIGEQVGCSITCTATVPATGTVNTSIAFTASSILSGCTGSPSYLWNFGDGSPNSTSVTTTHTYTAAGTYNWTMTVTTIGASPCVKTGSIMINGGGGQTVSLDSPINGDDLSANVLIEATIGGFSTLPTVTCQITGSGAPETLTMARGSIQFAPDSWFVTWQAWNRPLGTYMLKVTATNGIQTAQSQTITVNVQPLLTGRLQVKDRTDPTKVWNIDKIPSATLSPTAVYLLLNGNFVATIPVAGDGTFSSRSPNIENSFVDNRRYDVIVRLQYKDYLDVPSVGPPLFKERFAERNAGWVELNNGKRTQAANFDSSYPLPIFMHHGIESDDATWNSWSSYLTTNGYIAFTTRHEYRGGKFAEYSDAITSQIYADLGDLFTNRYAPKYFFITHSQGGIVARVATWREPAIRSQIKRIYAIAAPHTGTTLPYAPLLSGVAELVVPGTWGLTRSEMLKFNVDFPYFRSLSNSSMLSDADRNLVFAIGGTYVYDGTDGVVRPQESVFNILTEREEIYSNFPNPFNPSVQDTLWSRTVIKPEQKFSKHEFNYKHSSLGGGPSIIGQEALNEILLQTILPDMSILPPINQAIVNQQGPHSVVRSQRSQALEKQYIASSVASTGSDSILAAVAMPLLWLNAGQSVDMMAPISVTPSALFICNRSGVTATTSIVAPNNTVITTGNVLSFPGATYTNLGYADMFQVDNPQPGNWKIRIANGSQAGTVLASASEASCFEFEGKTRERAYNASATAALSARLTGNLNGVTVSSVTADIRNAAGVTLSTITLRDDGISPDVVAGDRIYYGSVNAPATAGKYPILFRALGTNQGQPYQREAEWGLDVLRSVRLFTGTFTTDLPQDTNGDGIADQLTERIILNLPSAGTYTMSADLFDGNENWVSHAVNSFSATTGGTRQELLQFNVGGASCTSFTAGLRIRNSKISDTSNGHVYLDIWTSDINLIGLTGSQFGCVSTQNADLAIVGSALSPNPVAAGGNLTYTVTVKNNGLVAANSIIVSNNLPPMTTLVSCNATNGGVCGALGFSSASVGFSSLAAGASATITLTAAVNVAVVDGATLTAVSNVNAATTDTNTANNNATATARASNIVCSTASFSAGSPLTVGMGPRAIVAADFNTNGKIDLAVVNYDSNSVSVRLGDGAGGFTVAANTTVGARPVAIASDDFNRDGIPDLAIANGSSGNVSILIGTGTGGFTGPTNITVGSFPSGIVTGDFNNDGNTDFAVAKTGGAGVVSIYPGIGNGTFGTPINISLNFNTYALATGDFNNDGRADLVVTHLSATNNISVLINEPSGFAPPIVKNAGGDPLAVVAQDFNGDGMVDLATANQSTDNVSVFLGFGDGTFLTLPVVGAGTSPESIVAGDFNADGNMDLAVANSASPGAASVMLGLGNGGFGLPIPFIAGNGPGGIAAGYFNSDGRLDLAIANSASTSNTVSILLSNCVGRPTIAEFAPTGGTAGITVTIFGTGFTGATAVKFNGVNATISNITSTSITVTVPVGATTGPVIVTTPNGSASGASNFTICSTAISPISQSFSASGGSGSIQMTVGSGCSWMATSSANWIVLANNNGVGNSFVGFVVTANTGAQRTGTITLGGQTFNVTQAAFVCPTITVNPTTASNGFVGTTYSQSFTQTGGVGTIIWSSIGALPSGLALNPSTGVLSGTPTTQNTFTFTIRATTTTGCFGERQHTIVIGGNGLMFYPLPRPIRLFDTRGPIPGFPACEYLSQPLAGGVEFVKQARISCDGITIPADAQAIVGNATVVTPSGNGYIILWPDGEQRPPASNLNYVTGQIVPNAFTVRLGDNGQFRVYSPATTDFLIDITGYFAPPKPTGLYYHPLPRPIRLFDTRGPIPGFPACEYLGQPLAGGVEFVKQAKISCNGITIPADAQAIVGNATVISPSGNGYILIWPDGQQRPPASVLNYVTGQIVPNAFTVGLGSNGQFRIFPLTNTGFIVDITGYYSPSPSDANGTGLLYSPLTRPIRLFDTRGPISGFPACEYLSQPLIGGVEFVKQARITCDGQTIPSNAQAIVANGTVVIASGDGYVLIWPDGQPRPPASVLNYVTGQIVPNAFTVRLGSNGQFRIYPLTDTGFIVDIAGFYAP